MEKIRKRRSTGRVTLQEVASFAGVGAMTVSRALRTPEQVSDKLREKMEQTVEELGYIPNRTTGVLAPGHSHTVAILVPSLMDEASSRFIQSLQQVPNKNELQLLPGCHEYNQLERTEILMTLPQGNPAALIIFGFQLVDKTHQILEKANIPAVNVVGFPFSPARITIEVAFLEVSHELAEHLLEQGYKNIGFIGARMENRL